jgi:hypothetical protein
MFFWLWARRKRSSSRWRSSWRSTAVVDSKMWVVRASPCRLAWQKACKLHGERRRTLGVPHFPQAGNRRQAERPLPAYNGGSLSRSQARFCCRLLEGK